MVLSIVEVFFKMKQAELINFALALEVKKGLIYWLGNAFGKVKWQ